MRSALLTKSSQPAALEIARRFKEAAQRASSSEISEETLDRWIDFLQGKSDLKLLLDSVEIFRSAALSSVAMPATIAVLANHLIAKGTPDVSEYRRAVLAPIIKAIRAALSQESDQARYHLLAHGLESYGNIAPTEEGSETNPPSGRIVRHFALGLGAFDRADAFETLKTQQDLLRTISRGAPPGTFVRYTLDTTEDPATGAVGGHFRIEFYGPDGEENEKYFGGLERVARPIYLRGWSIGGTTAEPARGIEQTLCRLMTPSLEHEMISAFSWIYCEQRVGAAGLKWWAPLWAKIRHMTLGHQAM